MSNSEGSTATISSQPADALIARINWPFIMQICKLAAQRSFDQAAWRKGLGAWRGSLELICQCGLLAEIVHAETGKLPSLKRLHGALAAGDGRWICEAFSEIYQRAEDALA